MKDKSRLGKLELGIWQNAMTTPERVGKLLQHLQSMACEEKVTQGVANYGNVYYLLLSTKGLSAGQMPGTGFEKKMSLA